MPSVRAALAMLPRAALDRGDDLLALLLEQALGEGRLGRAARRRHRRSAAAAGGCARGARRAEVEVGRASTSGPRARIIARSMTFSSSRTLPGQWYARAAPSAAASKPRTRLPVGAANLATKCSTSARQVVEPIAQRRQVDREDVEPVVEVLAELALRDQRLEVAVGGRDDADVDLDRLGAADALELALLQHAQQLDLHLQRQVADLVEEQGAAVGELEAARRAARPRR